MASHKFYQAPGMKTAAGRLIATPATSALRKPVLNPPQQELTIVPPNEDSSFTLAVQERIQSSGDASTSTVPVSPFVQHREQLERSVKEVCWELSEGWHLLPHHVSKEVLWQKLRAEARDHVKSEPVLASHLHSSVLVHGKLEDSLAFILANKLSSLTLLSTPLMRLIQEAYHAEPDIVDAAVADMQAVLDRDPACFGYSQVLLWFKGFQAIQSQRVAHWLWRHNRRPLAMALQSRISLQFQVDIHPAAYLGRGVMIDHATGIVIGETSVIGDNVSMLHHVTIGGSGTRSSIRHPTVGHGVLLGAGATILGPITIGHGTKVGSGSVVVQSLPSKCVAVGVPARIIKQDTSLEPCQDMDQAGDFVLEFEI